MSLLDIKQILTEAKSRWLRPSEVCEIIRNYQKFHLTPDPPYKPSGGSLFLFDRKALRYFRKDGHRWRKKKDGKTVREAHEKLKSGSVDVLHCYYAHGEDNENFQRRSYWMLDGQLEHIVLVHYREVNEGNKPCVPNPLSSDSGIQTNSWGAQTTVAAQSSYASSPSTVGWNGQAPSSELEDVDSGEDFSISPLAESISGSCFQITPILSNETIDRYTPMCAPSTSHPYAQGSMDVASSSAQINPFYENNVPGNCFTSYGQEPNYRASQGADFQNSREHVGAGSLIVDNHASSSYIWTGPFSDAGDIEYAMERKSQVPDTYCESLAVEGRRMFEGVLKHEHIEYVDSLNRYKNTANDVHYLNQVAKDQPAKNDFETSCEKNADQQEVLKKLDSFGRWMNKELGQDCDESLMATDSGNYWSALDTQSDDKEVSSLSRQMQLDIGSLGPSLSQEQFYSILDFSPDWAYSGSETKVLISGMFLDAVKPETIRWCCMFGEIEVSAEVLTGNVLRCQAPTHSPGRVPFYITCSNRQACSEIREFEYREKHADDLSLVQKSEISDEIRVQIRFAKMLSLGVDRDKVFCSVEKCPKCGLREELFWMLHDDKIEWDKIEKDQKGFEGCYENPRDALLQKLLKSKLYEWLISKYHEDGKGPHVLDEEGQGVIHLAAALGYEWAIKPIVATGVSPSFRDAHGRTALHWAAYFGREETIATLVRLGAAPGAVEDPTTKFPEGRTAADLASSRGHKGIAGYLAEADLTCQLSSLTVKESVMDSVSATLAAEKAIETLENSSIMSIGGDKGEHFSLRGSLAAVRNSAQAAARIQAAFRVHSFRQRQMSKCDVKHSDITIEEMLVSSLNSRAQKTVHYNDSLHTAAVRIQQKYRGWKGRKEFLKIRNRIVKLQAHVRGHQVRKQYKKIVWSVGIVEKAILRWRRKGTGLRGFRAELVSGDGQLNKGKMDEYDFLRLGRKQKAAGVERALARVQSMARYPEARGQYMRLVASSQKSEGGHEMKAGGQDEILDGR